METNDGEMTQINHITGCIWLKVVSSKDLILGDTMAMYGLRSDMTSWLVRCIVTVMHINYIWDMGGKSHGLNHQVHNSNTNKRL